MTTPQLAPYLTLDKAASAISNKMGTSCTVSDLIGYAYRNEISICARISTGATLVRVGPIKGEENTIFAEAGSLPFISAKSCRALLLTGRAEFTEMTYPSSVNLAGNLIETMVTVWKLSEGEIAPTFGIEDCRVSSDGVLQLISKQTALKNLPKPQVSKPKTTHSLSQNWKDEARRLADEFFDKDTKMNCRRTLKGYAELVLDEMQELEIHGPGGRIDNVHTIIRDALSGSNWWGTKSK